MNHHNTIHHEVTLANRAAELARLQDHRVANFISIESYLAWMPDADLIEIFKAVGQLPAVRTVRISFSFQQFRQLPILPIPCQALRELLQHSQNLQTLTLDEVHFVFRHGHDLNDLANALMRAPKLTHVTLFNCFPVYPPQPTTNQESLPTNGNDSSSFCHDTFAHALARIPSLDELNLIFTSRGPEWICALLKQSCSSPSMKILRINVPDGSFLGDPMVYMGQALETNSTLKELSIRCPLDATGGMAIANALRSPTNALEELYLQLEDYNFAIPIVQALQTNNRLRKLELRVWTGGNRTPLLQACDVMIPHNTCLREFVIDNGRFGLTSVLDFYLRLNQAGRRCLLEAGDKLARNVWVDFLSRFHPDVSVLYYTLSLNPSLCCNNHKPFHHQDGGDHHMMMSEPVTKRPRVERSC